MGMVSRSIFPDSKSLNSLKVWISDQTLLFYFIFVLDTIISNDSLHCIILRFWFFPSRPPRQLVNDVT